MGGERPIKVVRIKPVEFFFFIQIVVVQRVGHFAVVYSTFITAGLLDLIPVVGGHIAGEVLHRHLEGAVFGQLESVFEAAV